MTGEQPVIDATGGEPRRWAFIRKFEPGDEEALTELDKFMAYHAGGAVKKHFYYPVPDTGEMVFVYCESYEADDSDPALRKRRVVLVEVLKAN